MVIISKFDNIVHPWCDILFWNKSNAMDIWSALVRTHPCVSAVFGLINTFIYMFSTTLSYDLTPPQHILRRGLSVKKVFTYPTVLYKMFPPGALSLILIKLMSICNLIPLIFILLTAAARCNAMIYLNIQLISNLTYENVLKTFSPDNSKVKLWIYMKSKALYVSNILYTGLPTANDIIFVWYSYSNTQW